MSQPPIFLRRHLPCTMTVEVLRFPDPAILRVDYRLAMPTFGFDLTAQALLSAEVVERNPNRDDFLMAIGRDALSRSLGILLNQSPRIVPVPPSAAPIAPPPSSRALQAADEGHHPSSRILSESDKEMLRGYNISPE